MDGEFWRALDHKDTTQAIVDRTYSVHCPHCGAYSNVTAVSTPRWEQMKRYAPSRVIVGYVCNACNEPIALRFGVFGQYDSLYAALSVDYEELEPVMETFEFEYLPSPVKDDFREALTCYSHSCLNAAAAMCRRTIQSVATNLGAVGTDKVSRQLVEVKEAAGVDDEDFFALKQIIIDGHDGAHPHLPEVTKDRASLLIEMMKDVLYQLYVRKGKLQKSKELRSDVIANRNSGK